MVGLVTLVVTQNCTYRLNQISPVIRCNLDVFLGTRSIHLSIATGQLQNKKKLLFAQRSILELRGVIDMFTIISSSSKDAQGFFYEWMKLSEVIYDHQNAIVFHTKQHLLLYE